MKNIWEKVACKCKGVIDVNKVKRAKYLLIDTPVHGNLGDQAIVNLQSRFLKSISKEGEFGEIDAIHLNRLEKYCAKVSGAKTVIVPGGGFLGSLWPDEERRFRRIVQEFSDKKIIVFPQTVTFDMNSEEGLSFFEESKKIYSSNKNLTLYVREKQSYDFMKKYMPKVRVKLVPDTVLLWEPEASHKDRKNIIWSMRRDKEKNLSDEDFERIKNVIHSKVDFESEMELDTVLDGKTITKDNREQYLGKFIDNYYNAKLVVTDRLHGMIFAAVTGTPCIAFGNSNGKVKGVYEWIKDSEYVKYLDDVSDLERVMDKLNLEKSYALDRNEIREKFKPLLEEFD